MRCRQGFDENEREVLLDNVISLLLRSLGENTRDNSIVTEAVDFAELAAQRRSR